MRVLWTHNFDPASPGSQVFMNVAASGLRSRGIQLHCEYLGNLRSLRNLRAARHRVRQMARDFDVVHAQYGSACGLATSAMPGIPKVVSIRGNDWNLHSSSIDFDYFHTRLARWMTRRALPRYDLVLTVSRRVAADVQRSMPGVRTVPLPSAIDLERFVPRDKSDARKLLGFPGDTRRWVLFNALNLDDRIKRFDLAKRAFELANARCGNLRLCMATGMTHDEVALLVSACDVILCTSETEGWPNSVKEALACNVPFVATDVSDLRDIASVEPSCRVCADDPAILAEQICEVVALPEVGDLRKHVVPMSLGASSDRLISLYESLVVGKD